MSGARDPPRPAAIETRGRFRLFDPDGADITPPGPKARAFLAVIALAPGRRRSRAWLQRALWSDRSAEQAGASLRRLLANLRAATPPGCALLEADRTDVWIGADVRVDAGPAPCEGAVRLDGLELKDAAFMRWLAGVRGGAPRDPAPADAPRAPPAVGLHAPQTVLIDPSAVGRAPEAMFLASVLIDALTKRIASHGLVAAVAGGAPGWAAEAGGAGAAARIELSSDGQDRRPTLSLRAVHGPERRFLWSGRLVCAEDVETFVGRPALGAFVSAACTGILLGAAGAARHAPPPSARLHAAAMRLFSGNLPAIHDAEAALGAMRADGRIDGGVLLAWDAFARLTRGYEAAAVTDALRAESLALAAEAVVRAPTNAIVLALAATIECQFGGDLDRGHYLARAAIRADENSPYAIDAKADVALAMGDAATAYRSAMRARHVAEGMPNAYYWDMTVCLAALRMGDLPTAQRAARTAQIAQPGYRPALRYLTATSLLAGDRTAAALWATRLADREPGFTLRRLLEPAYPVATLRLAGLHDRLRP